MKLPISKLSQLTGVHRDTISKRLAHLVFEPARKAQSCTAQRTLPEIYKSDSLEAARAKQALSQAALNEVREQELRKQRIPIQDALDMMDEVFQAMSAILKAAEGTAHAESHQRSV